MFGTKWKGMECEGVFEKMAVVVTVSLEIKFGRIKQSA